MSVHCPNCGAEIGGAECRRAVTADDILAAVAGYFGASREELLGRCRLPDVCEARDVAIYLAWRYLGKGHAAVGETLGGRHRTTVLCAIERMQQRVALGRKLRGRPAADVVVAIEARLFGALR